MQLELNGNFKGKCLVAMPNIQDDMFRDSVIYIAEHNTIAGAVGVMINKNLTDKQSDISIEIVNKEWQHLPLYLGGPVELSSGFILYSDDSDNLMLSGSRQTLKKQAEITTLQPLMLTAGYCMWETLQLEREVKFNNWLVVDNIVAHLLNKVAPAERYQEALKIAGVNNLANFDFSGGGNA